MLNLIRLRILEYLYFIFVKLPTLILGKLKRNLVYVHWGRDLNNFGDCLSPDILKHYNLTPVYSQQYKSDLILAGSILQWVPTNYSGYIIGTGGDNKKYSFPNAKILAVRGKYTLQNFDYEDNILLCDPGLLMSYIFNYNKTNLYKLGIIPHFIDANTPLIKRWREKFGKEVLFINVLRNPKSVIKDILKCEVIISSSLHGLIIADSYHIPNIRFVDRKTMPTEFYDYKFLDYYSSFDFNEDPLVANGNETLDYIISKVSLKPVDIIEQKKKEFNNLMIKVTENFKK